MIISSVRTMRCHTGSAIRPTFPLFMSWVFLAGWAPLKTCAGHRLHISRRERACRPSSEVASSGEFTGAVNGSTNGGASACTRVSSRCAVFTCPFFFLPLLLLPRCLEET